MDNIPPLREFYTANKCKEYYIINYCKRDIRTFDGISVVFTEFQFYDAFFESKDRKLKDKSIFSNKRAERIDWIKYVLGNEKSELYCGWDREKKKINNKRRVAIISPNNYVVVINILKDGSAKFITAYLADSPRTAEKIRKSPKWQKDDH